MSTVTFTNPGLIPLEAITTLGINVKEGENPIGFFGTGLKYAIAGILRTGQKITIYRGLEKFSFETREIEVRNKSFDFIFMNNERLGFTTELGKTWEMWQIFRELYSNCLDESGEMVLRSEAPAENQTTISIIGDLFFNVALKKNEVFLSSTPKFANTTCEIHEGQNNSVYYRGIKVSTLDKPTMFTYNLLEHQQLTEDRTLKYTYNINSWFGNAVIESCDPQIIKKAVTNPFSYEWDMSWPFNANQVFAETVMSLVSVHGFAGVSASALHRAEAYMREKADIKRAVVTDYEKKQINKAVAFLLRIGFDITQEIIVATNLGEGIAGQARNDNIYLAKATLDKGGNFLIGTILEEHLHIDRGFADESRQFQNFLLDLSIKFARQSLETEEKGAV